MRVDHLLRCDLVYLTSIIYSSSGTIVSRLIILPQNSVPTTHLSHISPNANIQPPPNLNNWFTKTGPALYSEIEDRNSAAKIAQLRTGHCGLNRYLNRFGIRNSPYCQCGYGKETMEHYLLECRKFREQRTKLRKKVGTTKMRVARLLGDTKLIKHTLEYINATGRLEP